MLAENGIESLGSESRVVAWESDRTESESIPTPSSTSYWFTQPIEHFGVNRGTWNQQYLVNATFYKPGGPIYMVTPGETPLNTYYTDRTHFTELAQKTNGLLVAVEHRFYGKSNPMSDLSGASLKHHTVENVLEDFAAIIRAAKQNPRSVFPVSVSVNSKVVFAGGSYGGALAAYMRAMYPNLVAGAWSSLAVLQYRLQNYQLDQSWGKHLQALGCAKDVAKAVKDLDKILLSGNDTAVRSIQADFGIPPLTPRDFAGLVTSLISAAAMAPNYPDLDYTRSTVCSFFNKTQSNLSSYATAVASMIKSQGYSYADLTQIADTNINLDNYTLGQAGRVWYYQGCAWYGNWQVVPPANCGLTPYRSQLVDLTYFQPNCKRKFGNHIPTPVNSDGYNRKWLGRLRGVSNIYYTVGSLDLWRGSSVLTWEGPALPNTTASPIFLIEGGSHTQDLSMASTSDLPSLTTSRVVGDRQVMKWIA
ncbi:hypothetical protein GGI20_003546 [Coemansia sp. BCRC 34301]|nr:hypothetical protein GGI20_003546 [Coemansia sp. BCRC 34301]